MAQETLGAGVVGARSEAGLMAPHREPRCRAIRRRMSVLVRTPGAPGAASWLMLAAWLTLLPLRAACPQGRALMTIGSQAEDRLRLDQLVGRDSTDGFLLRTPSAMTPRLGTVGSKPRLELLDPELRTVWNSAIPFSLNDGAMWAGRGANLLLQAGVQVAYGPVEIILAPQFTYSQNLAFQVFPGADPARSPFSSPWHVGQASADLPLRFGDQSARLVDLGQSSITLYTGAIAVGAATENQWWGPGIRNAIVMSDNAEGVPHLFLRTARPIRTALGMLEARWIIGGLTESLYFDTSATASGLRSLSGLVVTLRPGRARNLTLGVSRVVYGQARSGDQILSRLFDVVSQYGSVPGTGDGTSTRGRDQLLALFGRWLFLESGLEVYAEWARSELPRSFRLLLLDPHRSQGYTLGLQWARPLDTAGAVFRLQAELTDLEQSIAVAGQVPPPDYYTGGNTAQGYTQRGKVIGAAIGPGGSSEWLAGDVVAGRWQAGLFVGRIRWEDDALFRQFSTSYYRHDVSLFAGVRGGVRLARWDVSVAAIATRRQNYLFQNSLLTFGGHTVDVSDYTLRLAVAPR